MVEAMTNQAVRTCGKIEGLANPAILASAHKRVITAKGSHMNTTLGVITMIAVASVTVAKLTGAEFHTLSEVITIMQNAR